MSIEAVKLAYTNKTTERTTSQKLGSHDFWQTAYCVLSKSKTAIAPLFNCPQVLHSASDKVKLLARNFSKNSYSDKLGIP